MANLFKKDIFTKIELFRLLTECLILNLHFFDRYAFQFWGSADRNVFMDNLYTEISCGLVEIIENPHKIEETMKLFYNMYQKRQKIYAQCDIVAEKNEKGGYTLSNTVGWKLAEILTDTDAILCGGPATLVISQNYVQTAKFLKMKDFFS
ncbi:MAG: hypothetical protein JXB49_27745 [Bacteroidales bacterium]|nr:hypothetical protein [Bacteroidales bacterium]